MQKVELEKPTSEILRDFHIESRLYDESALIESLRKLKSYIPLPSERECKNNTLEHLVRKWFSQRIGQKYEEMSPELFELKREIEIDPEHFKDSDGIKYNANNKIKLKIPMLLQAELDKDLGWQYENEHRSSYSNYKLSLFSRIPKVPSDIRKAGKDALVLVYKTYSDALSTEVLSDVIMENPGYAPHPKDATLVTLWKPKPSEIHIEVTQLDKDPALILKYDRPYLVSTWREPNEEPFMHLLSVSMVSNLDMFVDEFDKNRKNSDDISDGVTRRL